MIKDLINERVLILLIFLVIISQKKIKVIVEDFSNSFNHKCDYGMAEVLKKVTKERGMVKKIKVTIFISLVVIIIVSMNLKN